MSKGLRFIVGVVLVAFMLGFAKSAVYKLLDMISYRKSAPERERFERLLEEKYGEKFVCFETGTIGSQGFTSGHSIKSMCAPAKDESLVFDAWMSVYDDNKLTSDSYPREIASRQLAEEFSEAICGVWGEYRVDCSIGAYGENDEVIQKIKNGTFTWRYYMEQCPSKNGQDDRAESYFTILIDSSAANVSYAEEWDALVETSEKYCKEFLPKGIDPEFTYRLYFSPHDLYDDCVNIMTSRERVHGTGYLGKLEEKLEGSSVSCKRRIGINVASEKSSDFESITPAREDYIMRREELR